MRFNAARIYKCDTCIRYEEEKASNKGKEKYKAYIDKKKMLSFDMQKVLIYYYNRYAVVNKIIYEANT